MQVISINFAILAITSVFIFYLLKYKYRIVYLMILSLGLIATLNYYLSIYVVVYTLINYFIGIKIPDSRFKKTLFRTGVIINLSQLIIFKYASFAIDPIFQLFGNDLHISKVSEIIVPIGLSFFTLQGIGYLINVKMGWEKPEKKFLNFLLYIIFYPKFLSGPIERSNHFLPQLKAINSFNEQQVSEGLRIALIGFFKKVVIANQLGDAVINAYSDLNSLGGLNLWIVILIQPLYLYFDFSGYTDIAIGFAKTYGIEILPNFNKPFLSENVTTFWKRFHMSLSLWFNDYVFKQVSFRYRKWGMYASVFAVFITFILFGIWHGAGWNFMALGLSQALAINYEYFTKKGRTRIGSKIPVFLKVMMGRIITYVFYGLSLVFFFSPNLNLSLQYFSRLFDFTSGSMTNPLYNLLIFALGLSFLFLLFDYLKQDQKNIRDKIEKIYLKYRFLRIFLYYVLVLLIMIFIGKRLTFVYQVF